MLCPGQPDLRDVIRVSIDGHPFRGRAKSRALESKKEDAVTQHDEREQQIVDGVARLAAEHRASALNRESDDDAFAEEIRLRLEQAEAEGAGGGVAAAAMRRFLEDVDRDE